MMHEKRDVCLGEHLTRGAAEQHFGKSAARITSHDEQVGLMGLGLL
jgi:hypothetical protein